MNKYPKGKLNKYDEGQTAITIRTKDNLLLIEFVQPIEWIALHKSDAISLANFILNKANEIKESH